jgi:hypothetical protein
MQAKNTSTAAMTDSNPNDTTANQTFRDTLYIPALDRLRQHSIQHGKILQQATTTRLHREVLTNIRGQATPTTTADDHANAIWEMHQDKSPPRVRHEDTTLYITLRLDRYIISDSGAPPLTTDLERLLRQPFTPAANQDLMRTVRLVGYHNRHVEHHQYAEHYDNYPTVSDEQQTSDSDYDEALEPYHGSPAPPVRTTGLYKLLRACLRGRHATNGSDHYIDSSINQVTDRHDPEAYSEEEYIGVLLQYSINERPPRHQPHRASRQAPTSIRN